MENNNYPGSYYQPLFDLLNQEHGITPLESEMTDIIEVVEKMRGKQPGPRWVKATNYDISKGGMLFYRFDGPTMKSIGIGHFVCDMFHGVHLDVFPKWDWKYLYILDEQPAAEPLTENARYELRLALRDMIKLVKRIYGDSAIPAEHQKRLDAADGLLQKHSKITDVLRTPAAGREGDAVAFAEWIRESGIEPTFGNKWVDFSKPKDNRYTTGQLYELFKQQKEK